MKIIIVFRKLQKLRGSRNFNLSLLFIWLLFSILALCFLIALYTRDRRLRLKPTLVQDTDYMVEKTYQLALLALIYWLSNQYMVQKVHLVYGWRPSKALPLQAFPPHCSGVPWTGHEGHDGSNKSNLKYDEISAQDRFESKESRNPCHGQ